jgi:hypothetical protein
MERAECAKRCVSQFARLVIRLLRPCITLVLVVAFLAFPSAIALAKAPTETLRGKALSLADLPSGWSVADSTRTRSFGCKGPKVLNHEKEVRVTFQDVALPIMTEDLEVGSLTARTYLQAVADYALCKTFRVRSNGAEIVGSQSKLLFPEVGSESRAFAYSYIANGRRFSIELVTFRYSHYVGTLDIVGVGPPNVPLLMELARCAIEKLKSIRGEPATKVETIQVRTGSQA